MKTSLVSGIDLVEIHRFRELCPVVRERFFQRVFNQSERKYIGESFERAAGVFAAKEALSKAIGCGIGPISWKEIKVANNEDGKPELRLSGNASTMATEMGISSWSVSISHTREHAIAMVIGLIISERNAEI